MAHSALYHNRYISPVLSGQNTHTISTVAVGGGVKVLFESELGVADFNLPNRSCILYVSECDIVSGNGYKRKLVRFRNVSMTYKIMFSCLFCGTPT